MSCTVIQNGRVIDPANNFDAIASVMLRDGVVEAVAADLEVPSDATVIDATGHVVTPGLIDIHVHFREPGQEYKEDIESGSRSAVAGGFTTVVCMANTAPTNDCAAITRHIVTRAKEVDLCRVYPLGAMSAGLQGESMAAIGDMVAEGIVGVSDDGISVVNSQLMRRVMEYAADFNLPTIVHSEDPAMCEGTCMHEGEVSTRLGLKGRPSASEEIMVRRDIALARLTGTRLHLQHLSTAEAVQALREAKADGLAVTGEVCPHHLFFTDEHLSSYDTHFKMNPPLRTQKDVDALRVALADGTIDCIATDHAPHAVTEKEEQSIETANAGVIGIESCLPVCLRLVEEGVIDLPRLVALLTNQPAAVMNIAGGDLSIGALADVTVFDPKAAVHIDRDQLYSKSRNCPYHGWDCTGKIQHTIVGGVIKFSAAGGIGIEAAA